MAPWTPSSMDRRRTLFRQKGLSCISCIIIVLSVLLLPAFIIVQFHSASAALERARVMDTPSILSLTTWGRHDTEARALPARHVPNTTTWDSIRNSNDKNWQGRGDPKHLGGFAKFSKETITPEVWKYMIESINIRSVLDIGCGRGWSTLWFRLHGVNATCVEGSRDAIRQTVLDDHDVLVEHDFSRGPWWPDRTYDAVWAADFVQQVSLSYQTNYVAAMKKAALIFLTAPQEPGWHHVQLHSNEWWIQKLELQGFRYNADLTHKLRRIAYDEVDNGLTTAYDGLQYWPDSVWSNLLVFFNPEVGSRPEHVHLFSEYGCFRNYKQNEENERRPCGTAMGHLTESKLERRFYPLTLTHAMDEEWDNAVRKFTNGGIGPPVKNTNEIVISAQNLTQNIKSHAVMTIQKEIKKGNFSLPKIPVVVYPYVLYGIQTAENKHVEENGLTESKYLKLISDLDNFDPNVVWIGDTGYPHKWATWCAGFEELVATAQTKRAAQSLPLQWPIYIVDFTDGQTAQRCPKIEDRVGQDFVRYSKRSRVSNRYWKKEINWVDNGSLLDTLRNGKNYPHTPLYVRTDTIESLNSVLQEIGRNLSDPIEKLKRKVDVSHFWPVNGSGVSDVSSTLRTSVSHYLVDLRNQTDLNIFVGLAGSAVRTGRRGVASDYIMALLRTKIVVVTQRDNWEDHYRLFEALISGAMVMTDRMLAKPKDIENGTSLIEFTSFDDLRAKIFYYLGHKEERLAIARKGRLVAMTRHRTWHRIEEIVFGDILTNCSANAACPYIVHAIDGR